MSTTQLISKISTDFAEAATRFAERRRLAAELDSYRSPQDIEDMLDTLRTAQGEEAEWMRNRLYRNLVRHQIHIGMAP